MKGPVNIKGAGPAGLTAAIVLRRHGFPVRVFESAPDVGHRLNGDFQGFENWSSEKDMLELFREIGIETNFLCTPYYGGAVFAPDLEPARIRSERPIFYLVRRGCMSGTLDTGLKEQALALGVEISFNHRLEEPEGMTIVGTGPRTADMVALGATFRTSMEDTAAVVFDDDIAPKGYAYLLVHEGCATAATVLYRRFARGKRYFERMARFFRETMGVELAGGEKFVSYGNFFVRDTQVENDRLYVGESAGFQDCLWGFGMRYALLSGHLAAQSIITGDDYDLLWKKTLGPMLETSLVNRYLFERFGHAGYRCLTRRLARGNPCDFLRRHYNGSFFKHLLLPFARKAYESRVSAAILTARSRLFPKGGKCEITHHRY